MVCFQAYLNLSRYVEKLRQILFLFMKALKIGTHFFMDMKPVNCNLQTANR